MFGYDSSLKSRPSNLASFPLHFWSAILVSALFLPSGYITAQTRSQQPTQRVVLRNPSQGQINSQPGNVAGHAYGSIQAAINVPSTGVVFIYLPCGTYVE